MCNDTFSISHLLIQFDCIAYFKYFWWNGRLGEADRIRWIEIIEFKEILLNRIQIQSKMYGLNQKNIIKLNRAVSS